MNRSMMPQQIMSLAGGGGISSFIPRNTTIMGQPHYLAYINPQEGQLLKDLGGAGLPGPGGVPTYYELFKPSTWFDGKGYQGTGLNLGGGSTSTSDKDDNNDSGPTLSASAAAQLNDIRQDEKGDWWIETSYRSGYGWATQHVNISKEHRETGVSLEVLFSAWEETDEMKWEDNIGSD